jgi:PglZ domain
MSHILHDYVAQQLERHIADRRVVVWFDPRKEFGGFVAELGGAGASGLVPVQVGGQNVSLASFDGSMYALRSLVERLVAGDEPGHVLLYLPGVERSDASPLMELELAGKRWEPQLQQLARNALRARFTEGVIDELLRSESITYEDIAQASGGPSDERPSVLKAILRRSTGETQLAHWLATPAADAAIDEKEASGELRTLIGSRLGLDLNDDPLAKWRAIVARFVLAAEFRADLQETPLAEVDGVPVVSADTAKRVRAIAELLRREYEGSYPALADQAEQELGLAAAPVDPLSLGAVDTFRFEEQALLGRCAELVTAGEFERVQEIADSRRTSFWLAHDVERQAQWEAVRLAAELGSAAGAVEADLAKAPTGGPAWIDRYARDWHRMDRAQRRFESWLPKLDDEADERAVAFVRHHYETVLDRLATGFTSQLEASGWGLESVQHQTSTFDDLVRPDKGRVAYVLVDAMRYEMGAELAERLEEHGETTISPAVGVLPSITTTGMAALMPGALSAYDVTIVDGKLVAEVDGTALPDLKARKKHLGARVPSSVDLTLDEVVQLSKAKLAKKIGTADLVVVRSQEIDLFGEGGSAMARGVMDTVIANLARAMRKLAAVGIERGVIASDHGHLFVAEDRDDAMKIEAPGGDQVELHRRCWIGRGGATPAACVRVRARDLGNDSDLDFVFPTTSGVFKAGGDLSFHHGGPTLQEIVIPIITFRSSAVPADAGDSAELAVTSVPAAITNRMFSVKLSYASLLATDMPVMPILVHDDRQVGSVGMVLDGERLASGAVAIRPGTEATLGFQLDDDSVESLRIVVLDPATDAVLYRSAADIPVDLGVS